MDAGLEVLPWPVRRGGGDKRWRGPGEEEAVILGAGGRGGEGRVGEGDLVYCYAAAAAAVGGGGGVFPLVWVVDEEGAVVGSLEGLGGVFLGVEM